MSHRSGENCLLGHISSVAIICAITPAVRGAAADRRQLRRTRRRKSVEWITHRTMFLSLLGILEPTQHEHI